MPISPVISKNLYLVPVDYLATGGNSMDNGFYREVYSELEAGIVFVPATLYNSTEGYYYIDIGSEEGGLETRDYIVKPDSPTKRYQVDATSSLQGVYNINRNCTVFKQIVVLVQNDEHYIVEKGISYGLNAYDRIVVDVSLTESEDVLICQ